MARISPRTIRAVGIQLVIPIAKTININIPFSGPNAALSGSLKSSIISNKSGKSGKARNKSVSLIRTLSNRLKNPAITPTKVPKNNDKAMAVNPTAIEVCPPCIILAKVSLPSWSVPNG